MQRLTRYFFLLLFFCVFILPPTTHAQQRTTSFDEGWLFHLGGAQDAEHSGFSDTGWRKVNLPHDWSIEDLPGTASPFSINAVSQVSGGFTTGGTGWYRKHFIIPSAQKGKRFILQFDGIYMNAEVWVNGKNVARHPYGYTSFWADITERIKYGTDNIIAVKVKNEGENSRWYSGSGIYRHVWFTAVEPLHIAQWGVKINTNEISNQSASVHVQCSLNNLSADASPIQVEASIIDPQHHVIVQKRSAITIAANANKNYSDTLLVNHPMLWDINTPHLYQLKIKLYKNEQFIDSTLTTFGIRSITADAVHGFRLNGQTIKLKGGCIHHDNGPLGAKAIDRAEERKIELLKASGFNAIRTAHNPPSPALLDACDRLGMLVIDEAFDCWEGGKNPYDYHLYFKEWWQRDIESIVLRDYNHPSIIMWGTGNEIPNRDKPEVAAVAKKLSDFIKAIDSSRFITCGVNGIEPNKDAFLSSLDIAGYNYAPDKYEIDHQRLPQRIMFATESFASQSFNYWMQVEDHPWVIGDFVWTAWDYIGEASIGWLGYPQQQSFYPWNLAYCGDIDICGWKRPQSYYRDVLWKVNQLSLFVHSPSLSFDTASHKEEWSHWDYDDVVNHWNWKGFENKALTVDVYSSCDEVELFLNDHSLGKMKTDRSTRFIARFNVPYQPGVLKAVGYREGKKIAESILKTAAKPYRLRIKADRKSIRADASDLSCLTVEAIDQYGVVIPYATNEVEFTIKGAGKLIAVGNANPMSTESNTRPIRKLWRGRCLAIIQAQHQTGTISITATAKGLMPEQITISSH